MSLDAMHNLLLDQPMIVLFALIATGLLLGSIKVKGLRLGSSGVLFAALYNLAARLGSGLQIEIAEMGPNNSATNPYSLQSGVPPGNLIERGEYPRPADTDNNN